MNKIKIFFMKVLPYPNHLLVEIACEIMISEEIVVLSDIDLIPKLSKQTN